MIYRLVTASVLTLNNDKLPCKITTNTSKIGLVAVIIKDETSFVQFLLITRRTVSNTESNELECLAKKRRELSGKFAR